MTLVDIYMYICTCRLECGETVVLMLQFEHITLFLLLVVPAMWFSLYGPYLLAIILIVFAYI